MSWLASLLFWYPPSTALSPAVWREIETGPAPLVLFRELSKVPRPSFKEEGIRRWIEALVAEANARVWNGAGPTTARDEYGNLLIRVPGRGRFAHGVKPVVLQAHLDMVVVTRDESAARDYAENGVRITASEGWLHSVNNATTLGADNGIGLALAQKYVVRPLVDQPPLEILLTVEEEYSMGGARNLGFELEAACLINLDWDKVKQIGYACTGAKVVVARGDVRIEEVPAGSVAITGHLDKLPGGHSAIAIADGPPNAILFASDILRATSAHHDLWLAEFSGGSEDKTNVIPSEATFTLVTAHENAHEVTRALKSAFAQSPHRTRFARFEVSEPRRFDDDYAVPAREVALVADVMESVPNGMLVTRGEYPGWETSTSLGWAQLTRGHVQMATMLRSFSPSHAHAWAELLVHHFEGVPGVRASNEDRPFAPGWTADTTTFLYDVARAVAPGWTLSAAPGGLELTPLARRLKGIPTLSFGANILDLHALTERVEIASVIEAEQNLDAVLVGLGGCEQMLTL